MRRYLLLHRHGHRAPAKNVFQHDPALARKEDKLWKSHMFDKGATATLDLNFPVINEYVKMSVNHAEPALQPNP